MDFTRRTFLAGAGATAGLLAAPGAFAGPDVPGWQVGWTNAPASGYAPAPMRLISGALPDEFEGSLYRNGPAWFRYGDDYTGHWFDGDGMVQRIAFGNGKAVHSGQFVQTHKHKAEQEAQKFLATGFGTAGDPSYSIMAVDDVNAANTAILSANGDLFALWEAGSAMQIDPATLETIGPKTWSDDLKGMPFLAHPKVEPNGRIWNIASSGQILGIYDIAPGGKVDRFEIVDIGKTAYLHDWAMSERHLILLVQPWIQTRSLPPFVNSLEWRPEEGLQILIIDKDDLSSRRWVEAPAFSFYHTGTACEDADGTLHIDAVLYDEPILGEGGATGLMAGHFNPAVDQHEGYLSRISVSPDGKTRIDRTSVDGEFPAVHPGYMGQNCRLTAVVGGHAPGRPIATTVTVFDWHTGTADNFNFGPDRMVEEHVMVPKPGRTGEDDAWLVGTVLNIRTQSSEVHIFDAKHISSGPLASFSADYSWPLGFHGAFVSS
ncbi:MAG: carotenoid oxygenase family protein [Pseudomonadota bacterium]